MNEFHDLDKYFKLNISKDKISASLEQIKAFEDNHGELTLEKLRAFMIKHGVIVGINDSNILEFIHSKKELTTRLLVAEGRRPKFGKDAYIKNELVNDNDPHAYHFRQVIQIPSVTSGQKVASIVQPTLGQEGMNVYGERIDAKPGRPLKLQKGQNTEYRPEEQAIYALTDGQLSITDKSVYVYPVFEVHGDLDLKIGNIDFTGNVVIKGNVPTGYTVKTKGDIRVHGLVEGAQLEAGGSIYILEGISGMNRGKISAGVDVQTPYINQGVVETGRSIVVQKSILHSGCKAMDQIICEHGNIVGGSLFAGNGIIAKNIGNKMLTHTELFFGIDDKLLYLDKELQKEKKAITDQVQKLELIGKKLSEKQRQIGILSPNEQLLLLKQEHSIKHLNEKVAEINDRLEEISTAFNKANDAKLSVKGMIYANVDVYFGKYRRRINSEHRSVILQLVNGEVTLVNSK